MLLAAEEDDEGAPLALVQAMWQTADGKGLLDVLVCAGRWAVRAGRRASASYRMAAARPGPAMTCGAVHPVLSTGSKEVQVRLLARGEETVLGDAASDSEVFLTTKLETR